MSHPEVDPRRLVRRWVDTMVNEGDLAVAPELFAPDLVPWAREWVSGFRAAFPDVSMRVEEVLVEGSRVVGRFQCTGSHLGPWQGHPPTGRRFSEVDEVYFFSVADGRITQMWGVEDNVRRFRQLGLDRARPRRSGPVSQMRLVVRADDYDSAVTFFRDALGGEQALQVHAPGERVTILDVGRATLELADPGQVSLIDDVEVGRQVSPHLRVAFEVADAEAVTAALVDAGAALIAPPTPTPWHSLNARLDTPGELQVTIFQELATGEEQGPDHA